MAMENNTNVSAFTKGANEQYRCRETGQGKSERRFTRRYGETCAHEYALAIWHSRNTQQEATEAFVASYVAARAGVWSISNCDGEVGNI